RATRQSISRRAKLSSPDNQAEENTVASEDNIQLIKLSCSGQQTKAFVDAVDKYAQLGLRTLCLGLRAYPLVGNPKGSSCISMEERKMKLLEACKELYLPCFSRKLHYAAVLLLHRRRRFSFLSGIAGTSLFNSVNLVAYNVFHTSFPVLTTVLDKDFSEKTVMQNPEILLYCQAGVTWIVLQASKSKYLCWVVWSIIISYYL
ncbi:hypothetical protein EJB05_11519, partial [Eragrostis curvula]